MKYNTLHIYIFVLIIGIFAVGYITIVTPDSGPTSIGWSGGGGGEGYAASKDSSGSIASSTDGVLVIAANSSIASIGFAAASALSAPAGTSSPVTVSVNPITARLLLGTTNSQVKTLQQILNSKGFAVSTSGTGLPAQAGSPGHESAYFGPATDVALKKFQCAKLQVCSGSSATTGYGATGPRTRAALNGK